VLSDGGTEGEPHRLTEVVVVGFDAENLGLHRQLLR
jgi:hypothetical protein